VATDLIVTDLDLGIVLFHEPDFEIEVSRSECVYKGLSIILAESISGRQNVPELQCRTLVSI
jgi:hypothetical protein